MRHEALDGTLLLSEKLQQFADTSGAWGFTVSNECISVNFLTLMVYFDYVRENNLT